MDRDEQQHDQYQPRLDRRGLPFVNAILRSDDGNHPGQRASPNRSCRRPELHDRPQRRRRGKYCAGKLLRAGGRQPRLCLRRLGRRVAVLFGPAGIDRERQRRRRRRDADGARRDADGEQYQRGVDVARGWPVGACLLPSQQPGQRDGGKLVVRRRVRFSQVDFRLLGAVDSFYSQPIAPGRSKQLHAKRQCDDSAGLVARSIQPVFRGQRKPDAGGKQLRGRRSLRRCKSPSMPRIWSFPSTIRPPPPNLASSSRSLIR